MTELQDMLRVQARLHRKQGANALGQLFESAIEEIQLLNKTYNQLFDAFQDCQGELAKANERVKELEKELKESEDDLDAAEQQLSSYENALEEVQAVFVDSDACPLFEPFNPRNLSAWLNKFAIEKQLETARKCAFGSTSWVLEHIKFLEEQLRKEQE